MHKWNRQPIDFQTVKEPKIKNAISGQIQRVKLTGNERPKNQKLSLQTPVVG